jgi:hypothetical protein
MEAKAGCDVLKIAREHQNALVLIGGFDERILETNDRSLIYREIRDLLETMKEIGTPYVFGSDHTISPIVRYDTYLFALDTYREFMMY